MRKMVGGDKGGGKRDRKENVRNVRTENVRKGV